MKPLVVTAEQARNMLFTLAKTLKEVIEQDGALDNARKNLLEGTTQNAVPWRLCIDRSRPLRFKKSENSHGSLLIPEICCIMEGSNDDKKPFEQLKLELKLKSDDDNLVFRDAWDSPRVLKELNQLRRRERVILRYHFEPGSATEDGEPTYHMSHGGASDAAELCWFPSTVRSPRIPFVPLDLVLACELVVASFFPKKFVQIQSLPEWCSLVYRSELLLLSPLLMEAASRSSTDVTLRARKQDHTLLRSMWLYRN